MTLQDGQQASGRSRDGGYSCTLPELFRRSFQLAICEGHRKASTLHYGLKSGRPVECLPGCQWCSGFRHVHLRARNVRIGFVTQLNRVHDGILSGDRPPHDMGYLICSVLSQASDKATVYPGDYSSVPNGHCDISRDLAAQVREDLCCNRLVPTYVSFAMFPQLARVTRSHSRTSAS